MTRKLKEIEVEEISFVSKAATGKKFMIIKNAEVNTMQDLKDFLVEFLEDEDAEEFQKAENEGKLGEKLEEALKEIRIFEKDFPDSLRKAIGVLVQCVYKGYGHNSKAPSSDKKKVKKQISYWPSFDLDGIGKKEVEKINKGAQGDPFPSVTAQLLGTEEENEEDNDED